MSLFNILPMNIYFETVYTKLKATDKDNFHSITFQRLPFYKNLNLL